MIMVESAFDGLLPRPVLAEARAGTFEFGAGSTIGADAGLRGAAHWLRQVLLESTGLFASESEVDTAAISFREAEGLPAEGYRLRISAERVEIEAADPAGAHYAAQTLRQLLGADAFRRANVHSGQWQLPCGIVEDHPSFGWRGCLLDPARHFLTKDALLRYIDLLAAHKLNVLHLHLNDDQGWRMQIERYPLLTEVGGWRERSGVGPRQHGHQDGRPHGGYYTKQDLREIVAYAATRHVTVVPEIDVPGHAQAAIAAYPWLGNFAQSLPVWTRWGINDNVLNVSEETLDFFRHVYDEVVEVFPSKVICVGGDEVPTGQWRESPAAQKRLAELGMAHESELHTWFIGEMAAHLASHGRRVLGWDEIAEGGRLPDGAIIASWRGEEAGIAAARAGYDVVMCPEQHVYLDHRQSDHPDEPIPIGYLRTVEDIYRYQPVPDGLDGEAASRVLGAQAQLWAEHLDSPRRLDYAAFPRLAAFAEVVWSPGGRDLPGFLRRLEIHHLPRLDALGVEYRPLGGPHPWQQRPDVNGWPREFPVA